MDKCFVTWEPNTYACRFAHSHNRLRWLLVGGPGNQDSPSWSPDGTMLVYVSDDPASHLWIVNADGSDPRQLTDGADYFPDWW